MLKIRYTELFHLTGDRPLDELAGVCIDGIHYYDFKSLIFLTNTDLASLIDLIKCSLEHGVEVRFVNVNDGIKRKIIAMGLDRILSCD